MGVILAAWLCLLAAIWTIDYRAFQIGERLALTALFILFMGLPSAGALLLLSFRQAATWPWSPSPPEPASPGLLAKSTSSCPTPSMTANGSSPPV